VHSLDQFEECRMPSRGKSGSLEPRDAFPVCRALASAAEPLSSFREFFDDSGLKPSLMSRGDVALKGPRFHQNSKTRNQGTVSSDCRKVNGAEGGRP